MRRLIKVYDPELFRDTNKQCDATVQVELWEIDGERKLRAHFQYKDGTSRFEWRSVPPPKDEQEETSDPVESAVRQSLIWSIRKSLGYDVPDSN